MGKISKRVLDEIKQDSKDLIIAAKGKDISRDDLMIAEAIMKTGYLKASHKKARKKKKCRRAAFTAYFVNRAFQRA